MIPSLTATVSLVAQEQVHDGPQGPEFGKAAPIGLLVIVALLVVILALGIMFNRRMRRMHKRRDFAEAHGLDPFDVETIDRRMAEEEALEAAAAAPQGSAAGRPERPGRPESYWDDKQDDEQDDEQDGTGPQGGGQR